jgi:hypothetical protein
LSSNSEKACQNHGGLAAGLSGGGHQDWGVASSIAAASVIRSSCRLLVGKLDHQLLVVANEPAIEGADGRHGLR